MWSGFSSEIETRVLCGHWNESNIVACGAASHLRLKPGALRRDLVTVALELGPRRRVFAQALEWIGWCRAGKDEATALGHLVTAGARYAQVVERAGFPFVLPSSSEEFEVAERTSGTAATDFGAPGVLLTSDQETLEEEDIARLSSLVAACWATFDDALHSIPADVHEVKPVRGRSPNAVKVWVVYYCHNDLIFGFI